MNVETPRSVPIGHGDWAHNLSGMASPFPGFNVLEHVHEAVRDSITGKLLDCGTEDYSSPA